MITQSVGNLAIANVNIITRHEFEAGIGLLSSFCFCYLFSGL